MHSCCGLANGVYNDTAKRVIRAMSGRVSQSLVASQGGLIVCITQREWVSLEVISRCCNGTRLGLGTDAGIAGGLSNVYFYCG